jgi:hypothetical protein
VAYTFKHGDRPLEGITIQRAVGRGGFGEVYYALTDSGKQVAVKYLRDNQEVELRGVAHVINLKSPHLITIYDVRHNEEDEPFVIMEYVSGPSLRDLLIAEPGGLGPQKAAFFVDGIAKGLSYLHERGIVHRDLKPGNIFYDDGYVKIGDYGLSKHIAVSAHSGNTISVGTVHYMAPEIGSGSYTKSIDIYALGVMLYEMLTGRLPFTGSSMGEVLMRHLSDQPDVSGIPEPFAGVIAKALAKDPNDRYRDVNEMVEALTAETEVSESLASFDASVLTQTPPGERGEDVDRTQTTPPKAPPVPVLDARAAGIELPPIPPIPSVLDGKAAKKAHKLQEKARRLQEKAEKKARVVHAKLANLGVGPAGQHGAPKVKSVPRKRWQQLVIALIVLFAASGGLGVGYADGGVFGVSLLYLLGGLIGTLLAHKLSVRRHSPEYTFQDRLLYTACGFVFMLPAFGAGHAVYPYGFHRLIFPLTAMLLIFNWNDRIQMGRRQIIQGGTIFWHGFVAAIFAAMSQANGYALAAAILSAVLLVLVQSAAGIWPLPLMTPTAPIGPHLRRAYRRGAWERVEGAYRRVTTAIESASERIEQVGKHVGQEVERHASKPVKVDAASEAEARERAGKDTSTAQQFAQAAVPQQFGYQPSFVGRTANAGLSFLAKLLLLAGLAVALLYSIEFVDVDLDGRHVVVGAGRVLVKEQGHVRVDQTIPGTVVLAPLLFGTVLLAVARRNDGAAHFIRGFLGCLFAIVAALVALRPASEQVRHFIANEWNQIYDPAPLIGVGILLAISFALLFWPQKRAPGPIVI